MGKTFEVTFTSTVGHHTEAVGASSILLAEQYAAKEAKAYGCSYTVKQKSFPKYTKIKKIGC